MKDCSVLVIDDNRKILEALRMLLKYHCANITTLAGPERIPELLEKEHFDLILLDMNFRAGITSGNEGLYWLSEILRIRPSACVVMITAYGDVSLAVRAVKGGAFDFVVKPWENDRLLATINAACRFSLSNKEVTRLRGKEKDLISEINKPGNSLVGSSGALDAVLGIAAKVAPTDANVLVTGESGTGKELMAREIHRLSGRSQQVFVTIDAGAIPETLFESELFGHEKGAFTDAIEERRGKFELADGGTLFLDEIGNVSLPLQAKLLNALQNRQVVRLGGNVPVDVDIRLICATNADLPGMVAEGKFREDLLFRVNTIVIGMPPLRERNGDIVELAEFFLQKLTGRYGKPGMKLGKAALAKLSGYKWPGNVRELEHVLERAVILSDKALLDEHDLVLVPAGTAPGPVPSTLEEMERRMIEDSMQRHGGNLSEAARQLGISRQTLYNKIRKYS